ncbi:hypothetical protein PYCCODRAFT_1235677 [Trametes coccinea BRFM310]|uniref:Uncharacterized protein n=1 Tax=Trametes coccinea (strain BRFM310) TaxID=1353009 RepID=A0A1Y2IW89_TRAC3|nr:hypothetical protein PYCCODRAFT_1235677 [Trametes coccinea BRFM310]
MPQDLYHPQPGLPSQSAGSFHSVRDALNPLSGSVARWKNATGRPSPQKHRCAVASPSSPVDPLCGRIVSREACSSLRRAIPPGPGKLQRRGIVWSTVDGTEECIPSRHCDKVRNAHQAMEATAHQVTISFSGCCVTLDSRPLLQLRILNVLQFVLFFLLSLCCLIRRPAARP